METKLRDGVQGRALWSGVVLLICSQQVLGVAFRVTKLYGSSMVLQMEPKSAHVWGYGEPGSEVTLAFDSVRVQTLVQLDDKWSVRIPPQPQGGPYDLTIDHVKDGVRNTTVLNDVMFGDVWFCGGEENMEFFMNSIFNTTEEIALAETYLQLRIMHLGHGLADLEQDEPPVMEWVWSPVTKETISWFSAVCLLYAERLADSLGGRAVGVVEAAWTRTPLQAWVSARVTEQCNLTASSLGIGNSKHNVYHNAAIFPLTKLAIRGVIWNQGETSEEMTMAEFGCATSLMALEWRHSFVDATVPVPAEAGVAFPFGIVQVGADASAPPEAASNVRLYQSAILEGESFPEFAVSEAFWATTYDLADPGSHLGSAMFRDKQTVATRLADAAKQLLYAAATTRPAAGPKFELKMMNFDSTTSIAVMAYDTDVTFQGTSGFGYGPTLGNWTDTPIVATSGRTFSIFVDPTAKFLVYGHRLLPCDYGACAVYSDTPARLPAEVVLAPWVTPSCARTVRAPALLALMMLVCATLVGQLW